MSYHCLKCQDERPGPGRCCVCGCLLLNDTELARVLKETAKELRGEGSRPPSSYSFMFEERRK